MIYKSPNMNDGSKNVWPSSAGKDWGDRKDDGEGNKWADVVAKTQINLYKTETLLLQIHQQECQNVATRTAST